LERAAGLEERVRDLVFRVTLDEKAAQDRLPA
jgi:hypothetical protein